MSIESDVERLEDEVYELKSRLRILEEAVGVDIDYLMQINVALERLQYIEWELNDIEKNPEKYYESFLLQHYIENTIRSVEYARAIAK